MAETDVNVRIGRRVRELRALHGHTLEDLASQSGVSRSMISLIERGEASPTAVILERLAAGLGVPLAKLFVDAGAGAAAQPLVRRAQQPTWKDPGSGYLRRNLSPPDWPSPMQLVHVHFPPRARVAYETTASHRVLHQQVWMLRGGIDILLGDQAWSLQAGDCVAMVFDRPLVYSNPGARAAEYLVAICTAPDVSTSSQGLR